MNKVVLEGFIIVPEMELAVVEKALEQHINLTRSESGCLTFQVVKNAENPLRFDVYEEFVDRAAFDAHQLRVKRSHWGNVTINVERNYTITEQSGE